MHMAYKRTKLVSSVCNTQKLQFLECSKMMSLISLLLIHFLVSN